MVLGYFGVDKPLRNKLNSDQRLDKAFTFEQGEHQLVSSVPENKYIGLHDGKPLDLPQNSMIGTVQSSLIIGYLMPVTPKMQHTTAWLCSTFVYDCNPQSESTIIFR